MSMLWTSLKRTGLILVAVAPLLSAVAQTTNSESPGVPAAAPPPPPAAEAPPAPPVNLPPSAAEVVKLAQSGVGDDVVVAFVQTSHTNYNLSADNVVALKNAGISSAVISAMVAHDAPKGKPMVMAASAVQNPTNGLSYVQHLYGSGSPSTAQPWDYAPQAIGSNQVMPTTSPTGPPVTSTQPPTVVEQAPPPPRVEVVPATPGPQYYWTPGYWAWRHGAWVWVGGSWILPPHHGAVWIGGHWEHHGHGYIWIGGRWY